MKGQKVWWVRAVFVLMSIPVGHCYVVDSSWRLTIELIINQKEYWHGLCPVGTANLQIPFSVPLTSRHVLCIC
jgi:hypothetical protein